ncbi:hypothetical protein FHETE_3612 [Fusarium heterosporum]|uniref:Uncharacterized protein n=1 Tax=Fusarium heterosporum TaxID=42747 RepID=A0A8H5TNS6_FUSHE|nr:hypothetical protein FHETE_3612 [Fusarium heterosporum]
MDIFPHHSGQNYPSEILDHSKDGYSWWFFMPIDPDEWISDIWSYRPGIPLNSTRSYYAQSRTLIIRTSNGRTLRLGPRSPKSRGRWQTRPKYKAIAALPQTGSSRMFLMTRPDLDFSWVALEQVSTWDDRAVELPSPYTFPDLIFEAEYFHTSVPLEGVTEAAVCRLRCSIVTGLLFTYSNGTRRSVGQVRFDLLEPSAKVLGGMWLALDEEELHHKGCYTGCPPGIIWFGLSAPLEESALECLEVPRRGRLDWCFDDSRCHISHHDDSRVRDEMEEVLSHEAETGIVYTERSPGLITEVIGSEI